jgi:GNAT superfamily N-acetyltransferase
MAGRAARLNRTTTTAHFDANAGALNHAFNAPVLLSNGKEEEDIDSNRLFVYTVNGCLEAVFAFILGPDPTYAKIEDGQWLNDEVPYGTIHRLASAGDRRGVASEVIAWCLEHCESLRADTHADNKIMQHLLEKNGFARCGIIHVEDGTPRVAYQKLSATVHMQEE